MPTMRHRRASEAGAMTAYRCECGTKTVFLKSEANGDATKACKCGRIIVARHGAIYGTRKGRASKSVPGPSPAFPPA
jgi:hypothetical protein